MTAIPFIESRFNGMKHFTWLSISALKGRQFQQICHTQISSKPRTIKCEMDCLQVIKEAIPRKTLSTFRIQTVTCWMLVATTLCGVFSGMESKESRSDFRCDVSGDIDKDFIRDACYHQYQTQNRKVGIPLFAFIVLNVSVIPIVSLIYSHLRQVNG